MYHHASSPPSPKPNRIRRMAFCPVPFCCPIEEEANLSILFYPAEYHGAFGSIFPSVDICAMIPNDEADVAILEEPEHLNWFRVPQVVPAENGHLIKEEKHESSHETDDKVNGGPKETNQAEELSIVETKETQEEIADEVNRNKAEFGWAQKFRHVVGILHTNYSAYMTQYAVGTSFIAAPAISMLSSIVVRAYCHRVIRLSAVLPSLAANKEVTSNVHGVRSEFLLPAGLSMTPESDDDGDKTDNRIDTPTSVSVYFIGKLVWAKGFDKLLQAQDLYRKSEGSYFPIAIYGSGPDERAIERAFLGRHPISPTAGTSGGNSTHVSPEKQRLDARSPETKVADDHAEMLFKRSDSLREQIKAVESDVSEEVESTANGPIPQIPTTLNATTATATATVTATGPPEHPETTDGSKHRVEKVKTHRSHYHPFSIVGDLTGKSVSTAVATSQAVYSLADAIVNAGFHMTVTKEEAEKHHSEETKREAEKKRGEENDANDASEKEDDKHEVYFFDPPQSRYEWRRHPIPASFLGVKDHASLREMGHYKIFLNMSTTEVLCTTTAEALAMGKFVIIPKHRKSWLVQR